jgi:hypothetical protein
VTLLHLDERSCVAKAIAIKGGDAVLQSVGGIIEFRLLEQIQLLVHAMQVAQERAFLTRVFSRPDRIVDHDKVSAMKPRPSL